MSNVLNYFEQATGNLLNDNKLVLNGSVTVNNIEFDAVKFGNVLDSNKYAIIAANGAIPINGYDLIAGGTGLAGLTLAAPQPGVRCDIILSSLTSGNCIVKTPLGVTFDGTNNTATFNAVNDQLVLVYRTATQWQIVYNNSVTLSVS